MTLFIIGIGVYPNPVLRTMEASVQKLLVQTHRLEETAPAGTTGTSSESASRPAGLDATRGISQDNR